MASIDSTKHPDSDERTRRDFLTLTAGTVGVVGTVISLWPFVKSLAPAADVLSAGGAMDVNIASVLPGQQIEVQWRGMPIFIVRRTPEMLATLQQSDMASHLRDPDSAETQQPAYARNWHRSLSPDVLVLVGICTHLGCIPSFRPNQVDGAAMSGGGYFCACHGSRYDIAGRVHKGVPAQYNLPVPPHSRIDDDVIRIGENPSATDDWSMGQVKQL